MGESYNALVKRRNALMSEAVAVQAMIDAMEAESVSTPNVSMRQITEAVAIENHLTVAELLSKSRHRRIAWPRQRAFLLCRLQGRTLEQIARFFGGIDHTTVSHGIRQAEKRAAAK